MLVLAKKAETLEQGREMILENLHNGKGYEKFVQLVDNQGGDVSYIENTDKFEKAKYIEKIVAKKSGKITKLDALQIGKLSSYLGAGRMKKEDKINPRVGFVFAKKVGDEVKEGDTIGFVHADDEDKVKYVLSQEIAEIN